MVDLPQPIPAGTVDVVLSDSSKKGSKRTHADVAKTIAELRRLCKGSSVTVDRILEEGWKETEREEAEYRRLFHHDGEL
jgi:hypothetical protein